MDKSFLCIRPITKEFQVNRCCFGETTPDKLVKSQWQRCTRSWIYLIYRCFLAVFFLAAVIESLLDHVDLNFYFIYLTNWGILLCMMTHFLGAILVGIWHFHTEYADHINDSKVMPRSFQIYWAFHITSLVSSIIISFVYWTFLYNAESILSVANILTHACNAGFMFLDILIVAYPVRLLHVFMPLCFGIMYVIFTVIYYYCGGLDPYGKAYVYAILDWQQPNDTIKTVIGVLLLCCFIHMIIFSVYKIRIFIYSRFIENDLILPTTTSSTAKSTTSVINNATTPIVTQSPKGISMVLGDVSQYNHGFVEN